MKKILVLIIMILLSYNCSLFTDENSTEKMPQGWSEVEELQGGLVNTFFTDNNRIFAGKQAYGISYSDNNAEEWVDMNNGIDEIDPEYNTTLDRRTISAFAKMNGDIYIGVEASVGGGNYEGKDYEFVGGLYKYIEGENRWEYLGFKELSILDIEVIDDKFVVGTFDGIYILEEVDGSWIKTNIGFDGIDWSSIAVVDNTIFAARVWSLVKSSDLGENWTDIITGDIVNHPINCIESIGDILYIGTHNGVYISNDLGNNWIEKNNGVQYDSILGYSKVTKIVGTGSMIIATYLHNTINNGNDFPTTISKGILYAQLDELNWNVVEFQGVVEYEQFLEPFSIGIIDNKILVGIIRSGFIGSTNNKVWINSTILNEN